MLVRLKNPTCAPLQTARLVPVIPDVGAPTGCDPEPEAPAEPSVDLAGIAREAGLRLIARAGQVGVLPERSLAGLDTYFWLAGTGPRETQRTAAGFRMRISAWPVDYRWEFGDGGVIHGGPGEPGPPGASEISHLYQARGWYDLTVEVGWQVTFEVNGRTADAPGSFVTVARRRVPVDELRAILVG